jgi:regulatory protein
MGSAHAGGGSPARRITQRVRHGRDRCEALRGVRREGARSVAAELRAKGVGASVIASVVDEWTGADAEEERAQALAASPVSRLGAVEPAKAFNRLSALLMRRGFSPDVARRAARRALGLDGDE